MKELAKTALNLLFLCTLIFGFFRALEYIWPRETVIKVINYVCIVDKFEGYDCHEVKDGEIKK